MAGSSLAERVVDAVAESPISERVAQAQNQVYGPIVDWAARSPLHTDVFGHSVHPPLTDITLGCWFSATVLDLVGGEQSRHAATVLVAAGLLAAGPTAIAGAGDWAGMTGPERRIGAVHALGADAATFLFLGSLVSRWRGNHQRARRLALLGTAVVAGAGFLGGHLALSVGTADRT